MTVSNTVSLLLTLSLHARHVEQKCSEIPRSTYTETACKAAEVYVRDALDVVEQLSTITGFPDPRAVAEFLKAKRGHSTVSGRLCF